MHLGYGYLPKIDEMSVIIAVELILEDTNGMTSDFKHAFILWAYWLFKKCYGWSGQYALSDAIYDIRTGAGNGTKVRVDARDKTKM